MILRTELFQYQKEAVEKLLPIRIGALYFDMGTGKTRTALEIIQKRQEAGKLDKVFWLCPCSVKMNLRIDLNKHADGWEDIISIHGIESLSSSAKLFQDLYLSVGDKTMVIVDESNLIKNNFAIRTKRIHEIGTLAKYRMILNGTPVTKNEADLYAQWFFLDQRIFGYRSFWSFAANHLEYDDNHRVRKVLNTGYLAEKMAPYSVVVKKEDVLSLPSKRYYKEYFYSTSDQESHYRYTVDDMLSKLHDDIYENSDAAIYRMFTALQQVASGRNVIDEWDSKTRNWHIRTEPMFRAPEENPRIKALMDVLERHPDSKIIIWIKFQHEADDICSLLEEGSYAVFTGTVPLKKREEALNRFANDDDCQYLIANKVCGGYGLNLQCCHISIFYDNDFNYGTRAQAEDRIYRMGQTESVAIIDIVSDLSIDKMIMDSLGKKESLMNSIKDKVKSKSQLKEMLLNDKNRIRPGTKEKTHQGLAERPS